MSDVVVGHVGFNGSPGVVCAAPADESQRRELELLRARHSLLLDAVGALLRSGTVQIVAVGAPGDTEAHGVRLLDDVRRALLICGRQPS